MFIFDRLEPVEAAGIITVHLELFEPRTVQLGEGCKVGQRKSFGYSDRDGLEQVERLEGFDAGGVA
jgi:hypothetical protein